MILYLDDDSTAGHLIRLLQREGHEVLRPADIDPEGSLDAVHLTHAIEQRRVLLTHNSKHFEALHYLVLRSGGHHPGILVVRRENDPTRDMSPRGIVRAISKLLASGMPLADGFQFLNQWR